MIGAMSSNDSARLAPVLLVSMPQMQDPNFARTVILLADYTPEGAFGLVVNREMAEPAHRVVTTDEPITIQRDLHLYIGGPVEPSRAWVLTAERELDGDAMEVSDGVYLSASPTLIRRALTHPPDTSLRLVVGYAGWGPGQLDGELAESAWLMAPVQADLIFQTPAESMWETAIRRLGATPSALQASSGVH
jgi:putative transcriptional regulator